jgi:molybdopterin-containing oxidoreductase family iron-sulfur binding subunit
MHALDGGRTDAAALSRRAFLHMVGGLGAGLALSGCFDPPEENILPYTRRPRDVTPGVPSFYATTMELGGYGIGLRVESREGRPTKIEGNPLHPASLGATRVYEQASILGLYDPWRMQQLTRRGALADWSTLVAELGAAGSVEARRPVRILLEPTASPLLALLLDRVIARRPGTRVHFHSPLEAQAERLAITRMLGAALEPLLDLSRADVVLAMDADFADQGPFAARYARDLAARRRIDGAGTSRGTSRLRLYAAESAPTLTGSLADHRLRQAPRAHAPLLRALLRELSRAIGDVPEAVRALEVRGAPPALSDDAARWVRALASDLLRHRGRSLVVAGACLTEEVQALALALNALLDNLGATLAMIPPVLRDARTRPADAWSGAETPLDESDSSPGSLAELVADMHAGAVDTLVMLGTNPVYSAPADLEVAAALANVQRSIYVGLHADETAQHASWRVPARHYLESWGDARAFDGTASVVQPLIRPLYEGASFAEVLAVLAGETERPIHTLLRASWEARAGVATGAPTRAFPWETVLEEGALPGTGVTPVAASVAWDAFRALVDPDPTASDVLLSAPDATGDAPIEVQVRPDVSVYDGRFAGNPWLQELPDPITKLTWDNAAWVASETAARLGVETGDWLVVDDHGRRLEIPALIVPEHAQDVVTLHLGYGRWAGSPVAEGVGFDTYAVRRSDAPWLLSDARVSALSDARGATHPLARTQIHFDLGARQEAICRVRTLAELRSGYEPNASLPTLFPVEYPGRPQWGMSIDLDVCTGCSTCVVACQAENNVPVVGKAEVSRGREMHWLRIDRYRVDVPGSRPAETPDAARGAPETSRRDGSAVASTDPETRTGPENNTGRDADTLPLSTLTVFQPMLCQHCETAPCEYVCPVNATVHSPDGLNEMVYNRCIGTRFCSNNCPYKVRRFNWFDYNAQAPPTRQMQFNPEVTVRARGVMEKCTYCVQRIRTAEIDARRTGRPLHDGDVVTACQQACPTRAIQFGDITDPASQVSLALAAPHVFDVLGHLGTRPRTRYRARLYEAIPRMMAAQAETRGDE